MTKTFIYVSCARSREIHVFSLDTGTGEVALRQRLPTAGGPTPLHVAPGGRLLMAGLRADDCLLTCAIDPSDGELTPLGSVASPGGPTYVSCDRERHTAFVASWGDNLLAVFPLDAAGRPQPAAQVESALPRAHAALTDATNRWLLVPMLGADAIRVYRLGSDGHIVANVPPLTVVRPGSGPRHLVFSPDNRHVHCLNELDGSIDVFAFDAIHGVLELTDSVSMMPHGFIGQPWAAELRCTPDGAFLYATDRRSSTLAVFSVDSQNGHLALFGHYPTEAQPRGMAIDPTGRWLAVAGQLSNHLTVYGLDPDTGCPRQCFRHATGEAPICVEIVALP